MTATSQVVLELVVNRTKQLIAKPHAHGRFCTVPQRLSKSPRHWSKLSHDFIRARRHMLCGHRIGLLTQQLTVGHVNTMWLPAGALKLAIEL